MKRAIIVPADIAGAALDDLKAWLAITTPREHAALTGLLGAALEMCEAFTGSLPLAAECEEMLRASTRWQALRTQPVQAVLAVETVAADGTRSALDSAGYAIELTDDGGACLRVIEAHGTARIAVRFAAGMAAGWPELPESLRHGVLRLAAHHYREREGADAAAQPPAAIAALWQPWRRMRLA